MAKTKKLKQIHWTQRPENRDKAKRVAANASAIRLGGAPATTAVGNISARLVELERLAAIRLDEIAEALGRLEDERAAILKTLPALAQPRQSNLRAANES